MVKNIKTKKWTKSLVMLLVFVMLLGISPFIGPTSKVVAATTPGSLLSEKIITPSTQNNCWDVTLSLQGADLTEVADVVLLIDTSSGMDATKMNATKEEAKSFIKNLIGISDINSTIKMEIVTFDNAATRITTGFSGDINALCAEIDRLAATSSSTPSPTNIQAGIRVASSLLSSSVAPNRYIVLLGSQAPTSSYYVTNATGTINITSCTPAGTNWYVDNNNLNLTFNYSQTAAGTPIDYANVNSGVDIACPSTAHATGSSFHAFPYNHGIPTIYEAKLAKQSGIEIYSIALAAGQFGQDVLSDCSSTSNHYFELNSVDNTLLRLNFNTIASQIRNSTPAATNTVVTDSINNMFELVGTPTVSHGTANYDPNVRNITWTVGNVLESEGLYTLTYTVRIDTNTAVPGVSYPPSSDTRVNYINSQNISSQTAIPSPQVSLPIPGVACTVLFYLNYDNNDNTVYTQSAVNSGSSLGANMPTDPTRANYLFAGWNTARNGSGNSLTNSTVVNNDTTVYAQWLPNPLGPYTYQIDCNYTNYRNGRIVNTTLVEGNKQNGALNQVVTADPNNYVSYNNAIYTYVSGNPTVTLSAPGNYVITLNYEIATFTSGGTNNSSYQINCSYKIYSNGTLVSNELVEGTGRGGTRGQEVTVDPDDYVSYKGNTYKYVSGNPTVTLPYGHTVITLNYELREGNSPVGSPDNNPPADRIPNDNPVVDRTPNGDPAVDAPSGNPVDIAPIGDPIDRTPSNVPYTGDTASAVPYMVLLMTSLAGILVLLITRKSKTQ